VSAALKVCDGITMSYVEDETIILMPSSKNVVLLNETSSLIFRKIAEGLNNECIAEYMSEIYDIEKNQLIEKVENLVSELLEKGVLFHGE